jgi:CxxC-x17-CxxC domain-containing protein
MGKFSGGNRFGGDRGDRGGFGKRDFGGKKFGGGDRGDRFGGDHKFGGGFDRPQMHDATCSQCGKPCQVPFRPTGDREVFCNDCFRNKKHDKFSKPSFGSKPSFAPRHEQSAGGTEQFKKQFEMLNEKLEKILAAITATKMPALAVKEDKPVKEKSKTPLAKTKTAAKKTVAKKK